MSEAQGLAELVAEFREAAVAARIFARDAVLAGDFPGSERQSGCANAFGKCADDLEKRLTTPPDDDALVERVAQAIYGACDPHGFRQAWAYQTEEFRAACRAEARAALAVSHPHPTDRDAVLEEAAKVADGFTCGGCGMDGKAAAAIRSLKAKTPAEEKSNV